eukprot:scpid92476/ scgid16068/ 
MLLQLGERPSQSIGTTSVTGCSATGRRFHVQDKRSGLSFLVDTGAAVSLLLPSAARSLCLSSSPAVSISAHVLQAAGNSVINTHGQRSLELNPGLRRTFRWVFAVADVHCPILGAEFLARFGFSIDVRNAQL